MRRAWLIPVGIALWLFIKWRHDAHQRRRLDWSREKWTMTNLVAQISAALYGKTCHHACGTFTDGGNAYTVVGHCELCLPRRIAAALNETIEVQSGKGSIPTLEAALRALEGREP